MACGSSLERTCGSCGAAAPTRARFCIACGAELDPVQAEPVEERRVEERRVEERRGEERRGEQRRLVTVLFADISGYTAVAERLDHETVKALVDRCLNRLAAEVDRYGGRVDKFIGDNVMAVFGAPVAHENDAERGVRAALGMQAAMAELNEGIAAEFGFELGLRVGVNTGEVLAGRVGEGYTVVGDAVNVASRLQSAAPVGGVLVGERTQRAAAHAVSFLELAPLTLKGKAQPVAAWEVTGLPGPGEDAQDATLAPLVGRDEELRQLERLFDRVRRDGAPHLVTIVGQPGVGKTRLLHELEQRLGRSQRPARMLRGRCLAFGQGIVYWPLWEMLRAECSIGDADSGALAWSKLSGRVAPLISRLEGPQEVERRLAPLARLVGAEIPDADGAVAQEDEYSARESFFGAVRAVLEALAAEEQLVVAWEDIHWADQGTLDLIQYLSEWLRTPILQICLARDELLEGRPDWGTPRRDATVTFLEPLAPGETRELIGKLLADSGETDGLIDTLAERSGGNPLFAETIAHRIADQEGTSVAELPDTVQGLLAAQLDALEPAERDLVAHASVIGRIFWKSALEPVAAHAGIDLEAALRSLRAKDLIALGEPGQAGGEPELSFKHVLVRDVAYSMLPKAIRARKHAEVGALLEARAGERGEGAPALLAEHYGQAARLAAEVHLGDIDLDPLQAKALEFSEAAGDAAAALFSIREALAYYESAAVFAGGREDIELRIVEKHSDLALRLGRVEVAIVGWQRCLAYWRDGVQPEHLAELHRKIGTALAHKGERKAAIEQHQQGINLIKDLPPTLALVRLYEEAAWLYMQVGDNMLAIYAAEKALRLAEQLQEIGAASRAHGIFGRVFGRIGDTVKARENLERSVELARDTDPGEAVLALLALGHHLEHTEADYQAARDRYGAGLQLAERIGDVPAQIELHAALAQLAFYRCDWEEVTRASDVSAQLAEREGLVGKLCLADTLRGLLAWRDGDFSASEKLFEQADALAEQVGWSEVSFSALLGLAATQRDRGDFSLAELTLTKALAGCERAGLVAESIQAYAALALTQLLAGRPEQAVAAAERANEASERIRYPVGQAAALEALGIASELPGALQSLRDAHAAWEQLGRRLDATRCQLLLGRRQRDTDPQAAAETLGRAASSYEELGVRHLAEESRQLARV